MDGATVKIAKVRARPVVAPLARPLRTASGEIPAAPLLLIDVETDASITGRAYIFGYSTVALQPLASLVENICDLYAGKSISPVERMEEAERTFRLLGRQGLLGMVLSGIDMALWDVLGRVHNVPVVELLGGEARPIRAYDSHSLIDPVADRKLIEASMARGFKGFKIKLGQSDLQLDVATVAGVKEILGDEVALMVDYNQSLTVPDAIRRIDYLSEHDLHWVEEPVPAEDLKGHADIRAVSSIPIQTGENWWFPQDMARALAADACDLAMPDLMKIGGITGWLRAAGQGEAASIPVSSHIFVEASAHVLPVTPTCDWLEFLDLASALLARPIEVEDGMVTAQGPGLGMEWDDAAVERCSA